MKPMKKIAITGAAFVLLSLSAASANATPVLNILGGTFGFSGPNNDIIGSMPGYYEARLQVSEYAKLSYEFVGKDAGFDNKFTTTFGFFTNNGSAAGDTLMGNVSAGLLDFTFIADLDLSNSVSNGDSNAEIDGVTFFLSQSGLSANQAYIAFDDQFFDGDDDNHDDMVILATALAEVGGSSSSSGGGGSSSSGGDGSSSSGGDGSGGSSGGDSSGGSSGGASSVPAPNALGLFGLALLGLGLYRRRLRTA